MSTREHNSPEPIGYMMGSAYYGLGALIHRKLRDKGIPLTFEQYKVLYILQQHEQLKQRDLAAILKREKPAITKLIDILVKKKMINRKQHPKDRRSNRITLTKTGIKTCNNCNPIVKEAINSVTEDIPSKEVDIFYSVVQRMLNNITVSRNIP